MDDKKYSKNFEQAYEEYAKSHPKPVILIAGATGSGKSSLINLVLNLPEGRRAKTGSGEPVTQTMEKFEDANIIVFDSKGYETGDERHEAFSEEIEKFIEEQKNSQKTPVNIIWYCISSPSARILDVDVEMLKFFDQQKIPTALVLTQVDVASEEDVQALKKSAWEEFPDLDIFESSTDSSVLLAKGVDELYQWTCEHLDESRRIQFRHAANRDLDWKLEEGKDIIVQHVAAAFGIGFTPIPLSDAPLLIAAQMGMLARLSTLWGLTSLKETFVGGGLLDMAMSQLGKYLAKNFVGILLKQIPGSLLKTVPWLGTLVGGTINGAVGAAFTWALGTAFNKSAYEICQAESRGERIAFTDIFNDDFVKLVKELILDYIKRNPQNEQSEKSNFA